MLKDADSRPCRPCAGFDSALIQQVLVSGTQGTVQLHDFVVPRHELRCSFTATRDHRLREHETYDDTQRDEVTVHLDKPQVRAPRACRPLGCPAARCSARC